MGVLLGGLTSLLYGTADFLGGEGAKRAPAASVVLWAGVVSFPLITIVALVNGGSATSSDYLFGALAGASGAVGLVLLFAGLGRGHAAAVAPVAGAVTGAFPVVVAVAMGERPSAVAWVGLVLAVPAIVLVSWVAESGEVPLGGFWYGLLAGLGFGGWTVMIDQASDEAGLLPLVASRVATMAVVLIVALLRLWSVTGPRSVPKAIVAGNGLLDVTANVTLLLGLQIGTLALVAAASSFYPAVTVGLARVFSHEHLRRRQLLGLALTVVALAAISLG